MRVSADDARLSAEGDSVPVLVGSDNGRQKGQRALELECPLCRQPCEVDDSRRVARCGHCGRRLVSSARTSETEAWIQLYGRVPVRGG